MLGNGIFCLVNVDVVVLSWSFIVNGLEEIVLLGVVSVLGGLLVFVIGDYDGFCYIGSIDSYG